jgi:hypothetical protein
MISVQDYDRRVTSFFDLEANGFANYIASGGDRDFMRPGGRDRPALRLLLLHDDADREFDRGGAEQALDRAAANGWTVVSIKHDWQVVFAATPL